MLFMFTLRVAVCPVLNAICVTLFQDLNTRLKKLINSAPVILFMKGCPDEPRCGGCLRVLEGDRQSEWVVG